MNEELLLKIQKLKDKLEPKCIKCGAKIGTSSSPAIVDFLGNKFYCSECYSTEYDLL